MAALYQKTNELEATPIEDITATQADLDELIAEGWRIDASGISYDGSYPTLRRLFRIKRALTLRDKYPGVRWPTL